MSMTRRMFTQTLAFLTSAPKTLEMTDIRTSTGYEHVNQPSYVERVHPVGMAVEDTLEKAQYLANLRKWMKKGVPQDVDEILRHHARQVEALDPGIASMKSISTVGKVYMQQQENYRKYKIETFNRPIMDELYAKIRREYGVSLWR